ncbi:protein FAM184B isoform X3 [Bufo gargarizans]|uniref:protein FAM184B isoform X3 n=1 Tax=Bufo gargarizans TaxID=30331 RepID=UPI001CF5FCFF|nr:protein FAM184B isoform X3 [Bufo gargarizans]
MASGKNQHGMYNGSKASLLLSQEYTHELHVKMCKKIAQLTKVIYSLNLKIDEYEVNILTLKEAHQNEVDLISHDTKEKVLQYENMLEEEKNLRLQIQNLEEALEKNNVIKEQSLADFATYKKQSEERELKTQCEQAERIASLSKEMLSMKTDYENRLQQLTEEADALRKECSSSDQEKSVEKLNEKLKKEIQVLGKEVENLKTQNRKLTEEYTLKTSKLHSGYVKEKENLRKALQQSVTEMIKQLQNKEQEQRKGSQAKEAATLQELQLLKDDLEAKELEMLEVKQHSHKMKDMVQDLEAQLRQKEEELAESRNIQRNAAEELSVAKQRLLQQENEIQKQTEQMKSSSCAHKAALAELAEFKSQMDQQQQKPARKTTASKRDSGDVVNAKQYSREHSVPKQHKEDISKTKRQKEAETKHLKEQHVKSREDLAKIHAAEIKSIQSSMEQEKRRLQKDHEMHIEELKKTSEYEIKQLLEERDALYVQLQDSIYKQNKAILQQCESSSSESKENASLTSESRSKEKKRCECDCHSCQAASSEASQEFSENTGQQEENSHNNLKKLSTKLEKFETEISRLEQENAVLRGTVELLSKEVTISQQEALELNQDQTRHQEELTLKQKMELEVLRQSHQKEMQAMVSKFSNAQSFLQAKVVALEAELKDIENKGKKLPRPEDLHLINCLQDKLTDKDQIIKHLLEIQNFNDDMMPITQETHRSQSFSCNPNAGSLTPTLKKKKIGETPTRVISVPNLAAYEKSFSNNATTKNTVNPMRNSPSLDHKPGYPFRPPAQLLDIIRPNRRNPCNVPSKTELKDQETKRPEWFTKYFSF